MFSCDSDYRCFSRMESLSAMFKTGLYINDLSMHDSSRDLVLAGTQQSEELKRALIQVHRALNCCSMFSVWWADLCLCAQPNVFSLAHTKAPPLVWMFQITLRWNAVCLECRSKRSPVSWKRAWRCWTTRWRRQMTFCTGWFPNLWLKGCAKESQLWTPVR